jgi:hypothetical protein
MQQLIKPYWQHHLLLMLLVVQVVLPTFLLLLLAFSPRSPLVFAASSCVRLISEVQ